MNEIINLIYDNLLEIVLQDFSYEERDIIAKAYKAYLIDSYSNLIRNNSDDDGKVTQVILNMERIKWLNQTQDIKKSNLLKDEMLDKLGYLSNLALKYAMAKLQGKLDEINITEEQASSYIEMMREYAKNVLPFNKSIADTYLSEGILDFQYAVGLSSNMSLRLGH